MQQCTNCGAFSEDSVVQCPHCRMKGRFRAVKSETIVPRQHVPGDTSSPAHRCHNCGEHLSPSASKCERCKMPAKTARRDYKSAINFEQGRLQLWKNTRNPAYYSIQIQ